jgi:hypothetical protein
VRQISFCDYGVSIHTKEHTFHTHMLSPHESQQICGSRKVVKRRFTSFSPPADRLRTENPSDGPIRVRTPRASAAVRILSTKSVFRRSRRRPDQRGGDKSPLTATLAGAGAGCPVRWSPVRPGGHRIRVGFVRLLRKRRRTARAYTRCERPGQNSGDGRELQQVRASGSG